MYAKYGNIDHQQKPQMLAYMPYMDPMGYQLWSTTVVAVRNQPTNLALVNGGTTNSAFFCIVACGQPLLRFAAQHDAEGRQYLSIAARRII